MSGEGRGVEGKVDPIALSNDCKKIGFVGVRGDKIIGTIRFLINNYWFGAKKRK